MQKKNHRRILRLLLTGAALLAAAAALVVWLSPEPRAVSRAATTTPVWLAARRATQIAALEKRLKELNQGIADTARKTALLRQQLMTRSTDELSRNIAAARSDLDAALDRHPAVVAVRQEMQRMDSGSYEISMQQAAALTRLHAIQKEQESAFQTATTNIMARMVAEQRAAVPPGDDRTPRSKTPEEVRKLAEISAKYMAEIHALPNPYGLNLSTTTDVAQAVAAPAATNPAVAAAVAEERKLVDEFMALSERRTANDARYSELFHEQPTVRAHVRADDPAIAKLDRKLSALVARWEESDPEMKSCRQRMVALSQERDAVLNRLTELRRLTGIAAAHGSAVPAATTNVIAAGISGKDRGNPQIGKDGPL